MTALPVFRLTDVSVAVADSLVVRVSVCSVKLPGGSIRGLGHEVAVVGVHAAALAVITAGIRTPAEYRNGRMGSKAAPEVLSSISY